MTTPDAGADEPLTLMEQIALESAPGSWTAAAPVSSRKGASFGGATMARALVLAAGTVGPGRVPRNLRAEFLRPTSGDTPVDFEVLSVRDGRSLATRDVVARQDGRTVVAMTVSFQTDAEGPSAPDWHAVGEPTPGDIERLPATNPQIYSAALAAFEVRDVRPTNAKVDGVHPIWVRHRGALPDDPILHYAAVLLASDSGFTATIAPPGTRLRDRIGAVTIDHTMWFHRPVRADQWLRIEAEPRSTRGGTGFGRGEIWDAAGRLVASTAQGCMLAIGRN